MPSPRPTVDIRGVLRRESTAYIADLVGAFDLIQLFEYTDTTRPNAASVEPGTVIYNSDDGGLNVSDGTNWRGPSGGWANT